MTRNASILTVLLLTGSAIAASVTGCELIASVDRNRVGAGGSGGASSSSSTVASTGGTTVSSTASTGGTGGMPPMCGDAGVSCQMPSDCSKPTTNCVVDTCSMGCCGTMNAAAGAACTDSGGTVCDGNGKCVPCVKDTDCTPTGTTCATVSCDTATHTCKTADATKGMSCTDSGGTVCDGSGHCVSAACNDGLLDGCESDTDCGGGPAMCMGHPACPACANGKKCNAGTDCTSKVCSGNPKTCQVPTCGDGQQNGDETDVDCGGSCTSAANGNKTCAVGKGCMASTDCTTGFCNNFVCATKADGQQCNVDGDCTNMHCVMNVCCAAACPTGAVCGNTGSCLANGSACQQAPNTMMCSAASCNGNTFTAASDCDGNGNCPAGTQTNCATSSKVCNATKGCVQCNSPSDCAAASCNGTVFTPAATCNGSNNCVTGAMVDCSTMPATPVCNMSKGCVQCNSGTDCPASCNTTNNMLTQQGTCNGSNHCVAGTTAPCSSGLVCANMTACATTCTANTTTGCAAPTTTTCNSAGTACLLNMGQPCDTGSPAACLSGVCNTTDGGPGGTCG